MLVPVETRKQHRTANPSRSVSDELLQSIADDDLKRSMEPGAWFDAPNRIPVQDGDSNDSSLAIPCDLNAKMRPQRTTLGFTGVAKSKSHWSTGPRGFKTAFGGGRSSGFGRGPRGVSDGHQDEHPALTPSDWWFGCVWIDRLLKPES